MNQIPFYYQSRVYAEKQGQLREWEASREADRRFADEVKKRADESLSSVEIGELVDDLIRNYGLERAMIMLARTVQFRAKDAELSDYVREHAANLPPHFNDGLDEIDPCICCELPDRILNAIYMKTAERTEQTAAEEMEIEDEAEQEI